MTFQSCCETERVPKITVSKSCRCTARVSRLSKQAFCSLFPTKHMRDVAQSRWSVFKPNGTESYRSLKLDAVDLNVFIGECPFHNLSHYWLLRTKHWQPSVVRSIISASNMNRNTERYLLIRVFINLPSPTSSFRALPSSPHLTL